MHGVVPNNLGYASHTIIEKDNMFQITNAVFTAKVKPTYFLVGLEIILFLKMHIVYNIVS